MNILERIHCGRGPDIEKQTECSHTIGNFSVRYKLPHNAGRKGLAEEPLRNQVNLQDTFMDDLLEQFYNRRAVVVAGQLWDYTGVYLQGYFGRLATLHFSLEVVAVNDGYETAADDLNSLKSYIEADNDDYFNGEYEKEQWGLRGFNYRVRLDNEREPWNPWPASHFVRVPYDYKVDTINGAEWLKYRFGGQNIIGHHEVWAYPIHSHYYLEFRFYLSPEIGKKHLRLQRMREDAERIMSSVTINRVSA